VTGVENIPTTGPAIIIINHIAFLDPVMVCAASPRVVIPLAKKEAFDSLLLRLFVKGYGAIPIQRGEADTRAVKSALRVLQHNGVILVAPEGTRSPTYQMQSGKEGAVMLALRTGAWLVPVGITGTQRIRAYWTRLKRAPIQLSIGQPFRLRSTSDNGRPSRAEMSAMTEEAMYRLARQLPPEFRGVYSHLDKATEIYVIPSGNETA
jgi:1-acyl-sn-glycerol-3-phosphate acyltransferase